MTGKNYFSEKLILPFYSHCGGVEADFRKDIAKRMKQKELPQVDLLLVVKRVHLVANAHIDPIWLWDFDEGINAVLTTFRTACDLLDRYDFIFCHNEALLYGWVEKYDQELFGRIREFIKQGKWAIIGGWYLQPDCNLTDVI